MLGTIHLHRDHLCHEESLVQQIVRMTDVPFGVLAVLSGCLHEHVFSCGILQIKFLPSEKETTPAQSV